jgi:hypothetical protein
MPEARARRIKGSEAALNRRHEWPTERPGIRSPGAVAFRSLADGSQIARLRERGCFQQHSSSDHPTAFRQIERFLDNLKSRRHLMPRRAPGLPSALEDAIILNAAAQQPHCGVCRIWACAVAPAFAKCAGVRAEHFNRISTVAIFDGPPIVALTAQRGTVALATGEA